jgi:S-adenosylmethionine synthetase
VILSVVITVGILVLDQLPVAKAPMILVVNANDLDAEEAILAAAKQYVKHLQVKSRNMTDVSLDLVIELRTGEGSALVRDVKKVSGVTAVSLLAHDGEVTF